MVDLVLGLPCIRPNINTEILFLAFINTEILFLAFINTEILFL